MSILGEKNEAAAKSYLHPLVNADLRGVLTLNYGLMVEKAAAEAGREYTTGATEWDGGVHWFADDLKVETVPLPVLNGSLN